MQKESILYGVIGLLAGVIIAGFTATYAVNNNSNGMMRMMGMHTDTNSRGMMDDDDISMAGMTSLLKGKNGDDFDKTFLGQMIIHHQGEIDMAKLISTNAKHDELKRLGKDIISAQSKEIDMMQTWQTDWGYKNTPTMSHDMNNM